MRKYKKTSASKEDPLIHTNKLESSNNDTNNHRSEDEKNWLLKKNYSKDVKNDNIVFCKWMLVKLINSSLAKICKKLSTYCSISNQSPESLTKFKSRESNETSNN